MKNSFSSVSKTSTSRALEAQYTKDDVRMTQSLINDFVQNAMVLENSVPAAQLKMTTTAAQAHEPSIPLDAANQLAGGAEIHTPAAVGTTLVAKKASEFAGAVCEKHPWLRKLVYTLVMAAVLSSCGAGSTAAFPTQEALPTTALISSPIPDSSPTPPSSPTPEPTQRPTEIPTVTQVPASEILQYPPTSVVGKCTATYSMDKIHVVKVRLSNGFYIDRWIECILPGSIPVAMVWHSYSTEREAQNWAIGGGSGFYDKLHSMPDDNIDAMTAALLNSAPDLQMLNQTVECEFVTGNDSGPYQTYNGNNPFIDILAGEFGNRMVAAFSSGPVPQVQFLPIVRRIPLPIIIPYRLQKCVIQNPS